MKLVTSGYIQRLFAAADPETILRRPNLRRFARDNGVPYYISKGVWMIDFKKFMETIAPKEYPPCDTMPRLRNIKTSVDEYNESHEQQINKHVVEKCMKSRKVFKHLHGRKWIINYDELEPVIDEFLAKKNDAKQ